MRRTHSLPFDPKGEYVVRRAMTAAGKTYVPGDEYTAHRDDPDDFILRKSRQLLDQRWILPAYDESAQRLRAHRLEQLKKGTEATEPVGQRWPAAELRIVNDGGGWYNVYHVDGTRLTLKALRRKKAEARLAELIEPDAGEPTLEEGPKKTEE